MNKRLIASCPILYGGEYLPEAIKAVEPYVEEIIMLYTDKPSYGHGTNVGCPESEYDLKNIAYSASKKVKWVNISANGEAQHRGHIFRYAEQNGYGGVLTFDADEVFGDLTPYLEQCWQSQKRNIGFSGFINFYKSFNYVCRDHFTPIRFHNLNNADEKGHDVVNAPVYHFGCAQRMEIMRYKLLIHGHFDELRKNWLDEVYSAWEPGKDIPGGLHLTAYNPPLWQAEWFDRNILPDLLKGHFNFNKDVIL